jgi:hypothetical protein
MMSSSPQQVDWGSLTQHSGLIWLYEFWIAERNRDPNGLQPPNAPFHGTLFNEAARRPRYELPKLREVESRIPTCKNEPIAFSI